jgi:mannosyltransferase OCH1-like enzyme
MIPKIIHQTWKTREVPSKFKVFQESWIAMHPGWEYRFYTDEDNHHLVKTDYPWLLKTYESYPYAIQKIDMARVLYLHKFGGLYVDLDFECLKPFDELLDGKNVFFGIHDKGFAPGSRSTEYCNALLASTPKHPFWEKLLNRMIQVMRSKRNFETILTYVLLTSGPLLLTEETEEYKKTENDLVVYPKSYFYASNWCINSPEERQKLARDDDSFAIHHFDGSWLTPARRFVNMFIRLLGRFFPFVHRLFTKDNG